MKSSLETIASWSSLVEALLSLASILFGLMANYIRSPGLSGENITTMPLISQDLDNGIGSPLGIAKVSSLTEFLKCSGDMGRGIPG